jgi:cyclophilin family peptidyl-prolyl cis-trans isomerase
MTLLSFLLTLAQATAPAPEAPAEPTPTPKPAPAGPVVVLETGLGRIRVGLHQDKAPITVKNFLGYVRAGHYDGTIFHRVIPNFMAQGGGMEPDMRERGETLRPPIKNEAKSGLRNLRGTLAMARTNDPNSATAQFFINVKDNPSLDYGIQGAGYAVFGEVLEGMEVVDRMVSVQTTSKGPHRNVPVTPIVIKSIREVAGPAPAKPPAAKPPAAKPAAPKPAPTAKPTPSS